MLVNKIKYYYYSFESVLLLSLKHVPFFKKNMQTKHFSNTRFKSLITNNKINISTYIYSFIVIQIANLSFTVFLLKGLSSDAKKMIYHTFIDDYDSSEIIEDLKLQKQLLEIDNIHMKTHLHTENEHSSISHYNVTHNSHSSSYTNIALYTIGFLAVGGCALCLHLY